MTTNILRRIKSHPPVTDSGRSSLNSSGIFTKAYSSHNFDMEREAVLVVTVDLEQQPTIV